jgi:hypothetical protein
MSLIKVYSIAVAIVFLALHFVLQWPAKHISIEHRWVSARLEDVSFISLIIATVLFITGVIASGYSYWLKALLVIIVIGVGYFLFLLPFELTYTRSRFYIENYYIIVFVFGIIVLVPALGYVISRILRGT